MAYSTEFSRAIAIILLIHMKMEECMYEFVSTKVIAEFLMIPAPTVVKILKSLNAAGITTTKEGLRGGILLIKSIADITLLDVFLATTHGPMFKTQMNYLIEDERIDNVVATISGHLQDAEEAMKETLKKTTLLEIFKSY